MSEGGEEWLVCFLDKITTISRLRRTRVHSTTRKRHLSERESNARGVRPPTKGEMTREENGENPSRIYRVPLCGDRFVAMKEKRKTALIIHRRRATADAFSTLYSFKRRRRRSSDSSSRRYSTGKHWARGSARCSAPPLCCPDLTQKQAPCRARFSPNPRPTLCNSNWDLIAAPLTPFIPRTDPAGRGREGREGHPRGAARKGTRRRRRRREGQGSC